MNSKKQMIFTMALIVCLVLVACNKNQEVSNQGEKLIDLAEEASPLASIPPIVPLATSDFSSIEVISDALQTGVDLLGELVDQVDDMTMYSAYMPMLFINDTLVMSTLLDHAMNGSKDQYDTGITRFPAGTGEGGSSLSKVGNVYTWLYQSFYDNGNAYTTEVVYDTDMQYVDIKRINVTGSLMNPLHIQIQSKEGVIMASKAEVIDQGQMVLQLVYCYDQTNLYGAYKRIPGQEPTLSIDLTQEDISQWQDLADNSFTTVFYYDGTKLDFEQK